MKEYLSIDVGGTYIKYGLIDRSGNIKERGQIPTVHHLSGFIEQLNQLILQRKERIRAVTISCPGKINTQTGVVYFGGALDFLNKFAMKAHVEKLIEQTCLVINDGKAAALSELWLGNLKGVTNGLCLTLGTGIGGGIILNGQLFEGSHFQSGEVSFMIDRQNKQGIQKVAAEDGSAVGFIQQANRLLQTDDLLDGRRVFEALEKGNPLIYPLFETFCRQIATTIINTQTILDMECVVIGGGISAQPRVIQEITKQYHRLRDSFPMMRDSLIALEIKPCFFHNDANLLGALYYYLETLADE